MNKQQRSKLIRELAKSLLGSESHPEGISSQSYNLLLPLLKEAGCTDIINDVLFENNSAFLPFDWIIGDY